MNEPVTISTMIDHLAWGVLHGYCLARKFIPNINSETVQDSGEHRIWGFQVRIPDGVDLAYIEEDLAQYLGYLNAAPGTFAKFAVFHVSVFHYPDTGTYAELLICQ